MISEKEIRERDIEARLRQGVQRLGGKAYKFISPGNTGVPDREVILPGGLIYFVELKTDRGRTSPVQQAQIRALKKLGCEVRVLYGMSDVEDFLAEIGGETDDI